MEIVAFVAGVVFGVFAVRAYDRKKAKKNPK